MMKKVGIRVYKIMTIIFYTIFISCIMQSESLAAVSINKTSCYVGDSFSITISGINGRVSITSNSNVSVSPTGSVFVDGSLTISGTAIAEGSGNVTITYVDACTTAAEPQPITGSTSKSITINAKPIEKAPAEPVVKPVEPTKTTVPSNNKTTKNVQSTKTESNAKQENTNQEENFYINDISITAFGFDGEQFDSYILDPKFNRYTYEYACNVDEDIKKIQVNCDAGEFSEYITIEGVENELKDGENIITVKLQKEGLPTRTYTIKVNKKPSTIVENIEIENKEEIITETEKKETKNTITMKIWQFVLLQIAIIAVEILIIKKCQKGRGILAIIM